MEKPIDLNFYPSLYEENNEQGKNAQLLDMDLKEILKLEQLLGMIIKEQALI